MFSYPFNAKCEIQNSTETTTPTTHNMPFGSAALWVSYCKSIVVVPNFVVAAIVVFATLLPRSILYAISTQVVLVSRFYCRHQPNTCTYMHTARQSDLWIGAHALVHRQQQRWLAPVRQLTDRADRSMSVADIWATSFSGILPLGRLPPWMLPLMVLLLLLLPLPLLLGSHCCRMTKHICACGMARLNASCCCYYMLILM